MNLRSALRSPFRSRAIVRSGATGRTNEPKLHRAMALTQLAVLALCAARVGIDAHRGPLSIEGSIALALVVVLAMSLVAKAIRWAMGAAGPAEERSLELL